MIIEDKYELLALYRCLFEAKFNPDPNDFDIAGSPIAAKLVNDCVKELALLDEGEDWEEWAKAEHHPERIKDLLKGLSINNLNHIKGKSRKQFIIDALAPLKASNEKIDELIEEVFCKKND